MNIKEKLAQYESKMNEYLISMVPLQGFEIDNITVTHAILEGGFIKSNIFIKPLLGDSLELVSIGEPVIIKLATWIDMIENETE